MNWTAQASNTDGRSTETSGDISPKSSVTPTGAYFVLKSIIVGNLYGVDIMEEAVEICKLRLFLKLAAQADRVEKLEPLPDIDFNIRAGNTLVGFARLNEIQEALTYRMDFDQVLPDISGASPPRRHGVHSLPANADGPSSTHQKRSAN